MLNPFVDLFASLLHLYMIAIIVWAVVGMLISFKIINAYQPVVQRVMYALNRLCLPAMRPFRKILPDLGGIDIAPILVILLIQFAINSLYTYFYNL